MPRIGEHIRQQQPFCYASKQICADRVVAELVEHDEKVVAEVVGLGQVRVLHRVPHSERVET